MKKFCLFIAAAALFSACNADSTADSITSDSTVAKSAVALPYPVGYSSWFEIGNADYTATIVQGSWKDWETNNLDNMKNWVADTVVVFHSDNSIVKGADSLMARWKRGRAKYASVIDTIDAVIPVFSTDKNENWVLVWGTDAGCDSRGTRDVYWALSHGCSVCTHSCSAVIRL